jgi:hypothetical protein
LNGAGKTGIKDEAFMAYMNGIGSSINAKGRMLNMEVNFFPAKGYSHL